MEKFLTSTSAQPNKALPGFRRTVATLALGGVAFSMAACGPKGAPEPDPTVNRTSYETILEEDLHHGHCKVVVLYNDRSLERDVLEYIRKHGGATSQCPQPQVRSQYADNNPGKVGGEGEETIFYTKNHPGVPDRGNAAAIPQPATLPAIPTAPAV